MARKIQQSSYSIWIQSGSTTELWGEKQANFPCGRKFCSKAIFAGRMQGARLMKNLWENRQWRDFANGYQLKNQLPRKRNDGNRSHTTRRTRIWGWNKRKTKGRVNGKKNSAVYSIWIQSGSTTELWDLKPDDQEIGTSGLCLSMRVCAQCFPTLFGSNSEQHILLSCVNIVNKRQWGCGIVLLWPVWAKGKGARLHLPYTYFTLLAKPWLRRQKASNEQ